MGQRKTHEEFMEQLAQRNRHDIKILGRYVRSHDSIDCICNICGHEWSPIANSLLQGAGCPQCARGCKTITHEQYESKLYDINPNIRVVDNYINSTKKIAHKCLIDGYIWNASPCHILRGEGCPKCAGHIKKTHDEYIEDVAKINPTIEVLGRYINNKTKILHRCLADNYEWLVTPNHILKGRGCPICANNQRRTQEEYVEDLAIINPDIVVMGEYVNAVTKIRHKCRKCGMEFDMTPYLTLKGCGCRCDGLSHGERFITQYLRNYEIEFISQYRFTDCRDIYPLPFDFYLVDFGTCIEYDGEQHFMPSNKFGGEEHLRMTQKHDQIKTQYCLDNNIRLVRISYKDNIAKCLNDFLQDKMINL